MTKKGSAHYISNRMPLTTAMGYKMKRSCSEWSWQLVMVLMLTTGSLFANSPAGILYPGQGTTVNGKAVYFSVTVVNGDRVQTGTTGGKISVAGAEMEVSPNTILFVGEQLVLDCGSVLVQSGMAQVSDGQSTVSYSGGESAHSISTFCGASLPDAPSAVGSKEHRSFFFRSSHDEGAASAVRPGLLFGAKRYSFWMMNGVMFGSSVEAAQLTQKCLNAGACSFVPHVFRSEAAMYGAGLPAAAGVSYLSYYLKKKGDRWWFLPEALVTVSDVVLSVHAAHYSH